MNREYEFMEQSVRGYTDVIDFWFTELTPQQWFAKSDELDQLCRDRFKTTLDAAALCELSDWRATPLGRLAEIIVLDQFSRNIYRDTPQAFSQDPLALALAQEAVQHGYDKQLNDDQRGFLYMPYMHSESMLIHEQALVLFEQAGQESKYPFEVRHKEIVDRFGRYPHRNAILGRESTAEEVLFLEQPGSSF
ncbi:MAG: DUF924 family protein [Gammaproteobacteria bacterium]